MSTDVLPRDLLGIIVKEIGPGTEILSWMLTSKANYKIINSVVRKCMSDIISPTQTNYIRLRQLQYIVSLSIKEKFKTNRCVVLQCPLGAGKTFMALHYAMNVETESRIIVIVPSSVLKVWINECIKASLYHADPEKSKVLIFDSQRPKHVQYVKDKCLDKVLEYAREHKMNDVLEYAKEKELKEILDYATSQGYISLLQYAQFAGLEEVLQTHVVIMKTSTYKKEEIGTVDFELLINDEYHKTQIDGPDKTLGLTGESTYKVKSSKDHKRVILRSGFVDYKEKIPNVIYKQFNIDNTVDGHLGTIAHSTELLNKQQEEYRRQIVKCVKTYMKITIFVGDGAVGKNVKKWIEEDCPKYSAFQLASSAVTIKKFLESPGAAVLYINTNSCEGLNIFGEALLLLNPDIMSVIRIKQVIGRLLRPNNPHENVYVNYVMYGRIAELKAAYARCYADCRFDLELKEYPTDIALFKSGMIIRMLKCDIWNIPIPDGCLIFDQVRTEKRYKEMKTWWLEHRTEDTCLNNSLIEMLYT